MDPALLATLQSLIPSANLRTTPSACFTYGYDNSREHCLPAAVVLAENTAQIHALVQFCHEHRIPLTTRGRGTATTGASVPASGGIVLSVEKMNRIIKIDPANRLLVAEPGVTNSAVQHAAAAHGFFWAPDPTSSDFCSVGGNLAVNAAGPRALKYGTCRENTLGLALITGDGRPLDVGVQTSKGNVGYDLTRLLIGSEGTLAIITQATLKLIPLPVATRTIRICYRDSHSAAAAITHIMSGQITPCKLEFIDGHAVRMINTYAPLDLPADTGALLLIEIDGDHSSLFTAAAYIQQRASNAGLLDYQCATDATQSTALWRARKALSPALRTLAPKKINEDVVVPITHIPTLLTALDRMAQQYGFPIVNFGHAGNGNIHVNLLINPDDANQAAQAQTCLDELFNLVLTLGGTLSGEHGIGLLKRNFVARELSSAALSLMRGIKQQFDPHGILNPGKIFL